MSSHNYTGFLLADREQNVLAASEHELVGRAQYDEFSNWLMRCGEGHATVSQPFKSVAALRDTNRKLRTGVPTMFVAAPVRDADFQVVGVLGLRIRPELELRASYSWGELDSPVKPMRLIAKE